MNVISHMAGNSKQVGRRSNDARGHVKDGIYRTNTRLGPGDEDHRAGVFEDGEELR